jgi:integrase
MKFPVGYGSVYKLSGKRRKPYVVMITEGWTDEGKQIKKILGYTSTKKEGVELLEKYHINPFNLDETRTTFEDIYNKWYQWKFKDNDLSYKSEVRYSNAYRYYSSIKDIPFIDINILMIQDILDKCDKGYHTKSDIKSLFCQLYEYSKVLNLPVKPISTKYLKIGTFKKSTLHKPFTEEEIKTLWNNRSAIVELILINIYTGMRPTELLKPKEVHPDFVISGIKTVSGIDRQIPLHDRIKPLMVSYPPKIAYSTYKRHFKEEMDRLGMDHTPHDCRHTFATRCDLFGVNDLVIKLVLGHKVDDITKGIYTHKDLQEMVKEINKIC